MAYKYTMQGDNCTIQYNITPDLPTGGAITSGEYVTINGKIKNNSSSPIIDLRIGIARNNTLFISAYTVPNMPIAGSGSRTFSTKLSLSPTSSEAPTRINTYAIGFQVSHKNISSRSIVLSDQKITYLTYRLLPLINGFVLERCDYNGTPNNEGSYAHCKNLTLTKNSRASTSDFTRITVAIDSNSARTPSVNPVSQALTSSGYIESGTITSASLLGTQTFSIKDDYTVTLTIGDAYDVAIAQAVIPRSFAILHLSGTSTGGVGIGMFTTSTEGNPKFEVDETHKSYFYGGIEGVNNYVANTVIKKGAGHILLNSSTAPAYTNEIHRYVIDTTINLTGKDMVIGTVPEPFYRVLTMSGAITLSSGRILPLPFVNSSSTQIGLKISETTRSVDLLLGSGRTESSAKIFLIIDYVPQNPTADEESSDLEVT